MTITHYDLFAGIGGFSLALDEVFYDASIKHIFCEWERFPTAVLKQHWPDAEYSYATWRRESLKAYGNAIVPQVAMQIIQAIRDSEEHAHIH